MTIPAYLTALADLCDQHGTHAKHMGPELRLLAGLPWGECLKDVEPEGPCVADVWWQASVTPADLARGWLMNSMAFVEPGSAVAGMGNSQRAAACAELAVLSMRWRQLGLTNIGLYEALTMAGADPHDGTIEGARAAWGWISRQLLVVESLGRAGCIVSTDPARPFDAAFQNKIADGARVYAETYRRELEAMK